MIQYKNSPPTQWEIDRAARAIHDRWSPTERQRRRQVAVSRQRALLAKLFLQAAVSSASGR